MKKTAIMAMIVLALTMASCSAFGSISTTSGPASAGGLSLETQLIVGTLKLEDTEFAVTADQASDLMLLWQVYKELNSSSTSAQEEVDALIEQIQATMTGEQLQAINDMSLSQKDFANMQAQTVSTGASQKTDSSQSDNGSSSPAPGGMAGGDMGAGGPPDALGISMDAGIPQSQTTGISQSNTSVQPGRSDNESALLDSLIELLDKRMAA